MGSTWSVMSWIWQDSSLSWSSGLLSGEWVIPTYSLTVLRYAQTSPVAYLSKSCLRTRSIDGQHNSLWARSGPKSLSYAMHDRGSDSRPPTRSVISYWAKLTWNVVCPHFELWGWYRMWQRESRLRRMPIAIATLQSLATAEEQISSLVHESILLASAITQ